MKNFGVINSTNNELLNLGFKIFCGLGFVAHGLAQQSVMPAQEEKYLGPVYTEKAPIADPSSPDGPSPLVGPQVSRIFKEALPESDDTVKYKVHVQLAGQGAVGKTEIFRKVVANDGSFGWETIRGVDTDGVTKPYVCPSSNSYETVTTGDRKFRTPFGKFQPLETSAKLLYNGDWDSHGPVTYYYVLEAHKPDGSIAGRGFAGLHNGHVAGANSHGCIRTTNFCAEEIYQIAIDEGVVVGTDDAQPTSLVFTEYEEATVGQRLGITAKPRRDFSSIILDFTNF